MSSRFYGILLGRKDFEKIENLLSPNSNYTVRVNNLSSNSIFDHSLSEELKAFQEVVLRCDKPRFEMIIKTHCIEMDYSDYDPTARGLHVMISELLRRRCKTMVSIFEDAKKFWFSVDALSSVAIAGCLAIFLGGVPVITVGAFVIYLYLSPTFFLVLFPFLKSVRISVAADSPPKPQTSALQIGVLATVIGGLVLAAIIASIQHYFPSLPQTK